MVGICPVTVTWQLHKTVSRDVRCFGISNHKGRIIASFPSTPRVFLDLALSAMPVLCHNTMATWICHRVASNGTSGMHWRHIKKRKYKLAGFENLSRTEIRKGLKRGCQTLWIFRFSVFFVVIPSSSVLKFRVSQHQAVRSVMSTSCTCSLPWQFQDKNSF